MCEFPIVPIHVSTLIEESLIRDRVYQSCIVNLIRRETLVDLIILGMVDFDILLGIDLFSSYHVVLHCYTKTLTLSIFGVTRLEWKGDPSSCTKKGYIFSLCSSH